MKLTKEQKSFLDKVVNGVWSINSDTNLIDVNGNVSMSRMNLTKIPVKFGKVTGNFDCHENELTSLVGAPQLVGGNFYCSYNQLTSLTRAPQSVGEGFYCHANQLTSLLGAPQSVRGGFNCSYNQLTSLTGAPQLVKDFFYIDLSYIDKKYYHVIIPEIEELISRGINLYKPDEYYHPYKEIHYKNKLIELL
jgi:hypothetical protein